jgi:hypothetical protein
LAHSSGVKRSQEAPICRQVASVVRGSAKRNSTESAGGRCRRDPVAGVEAFLNVTFMLEEAPHRTVTRRRAACDQLGDDRSLTSRSRFQLLKFLSTLLHL